MDFTPVSRFSECGHFIDFRFLSRPLSTFSASFVQSDIVTTQEIGSEIAFEDPSRRSELKILSCCAWPSQTIILMSFRLRSTSMT